MVKYTRLSSRKSVSSNSCLLSCVGSSSVAHSISSKMLWQRGELSSRGQFTTLSLTMRPQPRFLPKQRSLSSLLASSCGARESKNAATWVRNFASRCFARLTTETTAMGSSWSSSLTTRPTVLCAMTWSTKALQS